MSADNAELARAFIDAFNEQSLDALASLVHPQIEIHSRRGIRRGDEEAIAWATSRPEGELEQHWVAEEIEDHGESVLAFVRNQWRWRATGEVGDEVASFVVFDFAEGKVVRWRRFDARDEALAAIERRERA